MWVAFLASFFISTPAFTQVTNLDRGTLVDGLRREGMGELLKHLVETEPSNDPVLNKQILINQLLLDYDAKLAEATKAASPDDAGRLRGEAAAAFSRALQERRGLIAQFADHEQRPLWQTDLAEQLLFEFLQVGRQNAAEFYEFGVPSAEQREAFESAVPEALEQLVQADLRFFELQGELPKQPDHTRKRIDTGLWDRMIGQYYQLRTQYFLAYAAQYASLLPDAHPYYANLNNPKIPNQRKTPAEEKNRLRGLVVERLDKFAKDAADTHGIRRPALSLTGRALTGLNRIDEALAALEAAVNLPSPSASDAPARLAELAARIARAVALDRKGQTPDALSQLGALEGSGLAKENLLYRVLVVDAEHRVLRRRADTLPPNPADKAAAAVAEAYAPYSRLLSDPALGENADALRRFVYRRWESSIPAGEDLGKLPALVVAAMGETAREAGKDLVEAARAAEEAKDSTRAAQLQGQALGKLTRAAQINEGLLKRKDLPPAVAAQAKFNLALATYYRDPRDAKGQVAAAKLLTEVADAYPDQPMAETAITYAVGTLHALVDAATPPAGAPQAYEAAGKVLLEKYPTAAAADDERVYYAAKVLAPAGRYAEAADALAPLPESNAEYFVARRDMIYDLQQAYRKAEGEAKAALAKRTTDEAAKLRRQADARRQQASGEEGATARQAAAWSRLILADMAVEADAKVDAALAYLRDFDRDFAGESDLIRLMLQKRIIALLQANQTEDAVREANRMMAGFPEDAAPVIDRVLGELDRQIDDLRRRLPAQQVERIRHEMQGQIQKKAESAVGLAEMLRKWAADPARGLGRDQLLPFELIYAKSLRLAGRPKEALAVIEPLAAEFEGNADVVFNTAEAYFAAGQAANDAQMLITRAAPKYDLIITRVQPEDNKYPPIWWNAWLRRLQISDLVNQATAEIPLRVRQLQNTDPNLGGEAFKSEFDRLAQKYAGK